MKGKTLATGAAILCTLALFGCQQSDSTYTAPTNAQAPAAKTDDAAMMNQGDDSQLQGGMNDSTNMTGVMMKDGKMMMMWPDGQSGPMDMDVTLKDGTKVMMDGKVMMKDGTTKMMKEGEGMMVDGSMSTAASMMMKTTK